MDVGESSPRSIGSGIRAFHSAESMEGRLVCVMSNMKPRKLAGYPSNGMLLCASTSDHSKGALCTPPAGSIVGERIQFEGITGEPATPNQVSKKKMVETVLEVRMISIACSLVSEDGREWSLLFQEHSVYYLGGCLYLQGVPRGKHLIINLFISYTVSVCFSLYLFDHFRNRQRLSVFTSR